MSPVVTGPDDVEQARRTLGRQLALLRKAVGYSQHQFAPLTSYGRSTIANVEVGRQRVPRGVRVFSCEGRYVPYVGDGGRCDKNAA